MNGLDDILRAAVEAKASDIHIHVNAPPLFRIHTVVTPSDFPICTAEGAMALAKHMMNDKRWADFEQHRDSDFSYSIPGLSRFRVNAHYQRNSVALSIRTINDKIRPIEQLFLPEICGKLTHLPRGLILVTGPTGSGKSTTLAGMVDSINRREHGHIITLEDPIEYAFTSAKCAIEQREVGSDVPNFASGLRHALRQDPDTILVGEMRDLETTSAAITAAETGHLVFSTLHTINAPQTIERIIDIYPSDEQNQIRSMLANTLQAVISQTLFKRSDQPGMIPGVEIMLCTPAVRNCIRENRIFEIPNVIETNRALGMQSLDSSIKQLFVNGYITRDDAVAQAAHPEKLERSLAAQAIEGAAMPTYRYEAKTAAGKMTSGVVTAANLGAAAQQLRDRGDFIVALAVADGAAKGAKISFSFSFGPSAKDVESFTSQLSVMVRAGISLRAAIEGIADQAENPKFKAILTQMKKDVESGKQFSDALMRYPKVFPPLYINMVKASELSGGFSKMLDKIAAYLAQQIETMSMVRGAMIYPGIIGTLAVGTTIFLLTFVLPSFMTIFKGKEAALPKPTKLLMAMSSFMVNYWYVLIFLVIAAAWGFVLLLRTEQGRVWWDITKLRIPLFKKLFRALYISRSLHTMGQLINAGVPMLDTLGITAEISGNTLYRRLWRSVYAAVKQGMKISAPLQKSTLLPRAVVQMISAGEESGKLGEVLDEVSEFYSRELKAVIKGVTAMIEPIMIVLMGSIVGFIAMSIILPIFKLSSLVK